jgi:hypothetical protein
MIKMWILKIDIWSNFKYDIQKKLLWSWKIQQFVESLLLTVEAKWIPGTDLIRKSEQDSLIINTFTLWEQDWKLFWYHTVIRGLMKRNVEKGRGWPEKECIGRQGKKGKSCNYFNVTQWHKFFQSNFQLNLVWFKVNWGWGKNENYIWDREYCYGEGWRRKSCSFLSPFHS